MILVLVLEVVGWSIKVFICKKEWIQLDKKEQDLCKELEPV